LSDIWTNTIPQHFGPDLPVKESNDSTRRPSAKRCDPGLIVCPGSLAEQWQDELYRRFHLPSLHCRRERMESLSRELEVLQRGGSVNPDNFSRDSEDIEDLEDAPDNEVEAAEEEILDQATAARTIAELKAEIETLKNLESLALAVHRSGADTFGPGQNVRIDNRLNKSVITEEAEWKPH
jgi:hypothetical protein